MKSAVAYFRTSSAANVGDDKDSERRQQEAVRGYAGGKKIRIVDEFYDAAVSGADPIDQRPAFSRMLSFCREHKIQMVLVETAGRFARDLGIQIAGHELLKAEGIDLVAVDSPEAFVDDTPTAVMVRQILGAVSQFEKASTVAKLRAARDRKRSQTGKCEGRKSWAEIDASLVAHAKRLYRRNPKTGTRRSLRTISSELAAAGYSNSRGNPFAPSQISRLVK